MKKLYIFLFFDPARNWIFIIICTKRKRGWSKVAIQYWHEWNDRGIELRFQQRLNDTNIPIIPIHQSEIKPTPDEFHLVLYQNNGKRRCLLFSSVVFYCHGDRKSFYCFIKSHLSSCDQIRGTQFCRKSIYWDTDPNRHHIDLFHWRAINQDQAIEKTQWKIRWNANWSGSAV